MARRRLDLHQALGLFRQEGDEPPPVTVGALADRIKGSLEDGFRGVRVRGEISNLSARNHWYFSIKDERAVLSCAMWQSAVAQHLRTTGWEPKDGDAVIVTGDVSFYPPQGRLQLYAKRI